jgi:hypothetical protein
LKEDFVADWLVEHRAAITGDNPATMVIIVVPIPLKSNRGLDSTGLWMQLAAAENVIAAAMYPRAVIELLRDVAAPVPSAASASIAVAEQAKPAAASASSAAGSAGSAETKAAAHAAEAKTGTAGNACLLCYPC